MHATSPSLISALNTEKTKANEEKGNLRWYVLSQMPIKQTRGKKKKPRTSGNPNVKQYFLCLGEATLKIFQSKVNP